MTSPRRGIGQSTAWMVVASTVLNLSMVVYHRIMSGGLGDAYAELMVLTGLVNVAAMGTQGMNAYLVKAFSRDAQLGGGGAVKAHLAQVTRKLALGLAGMGLLMAAAAPLVVAYLNLPGYGPYLVIVGVFLLGTVLLAARASVQGLHHFGALGFSLMSEGAGRIVAGAALVWSGFGLMGGLGSIVAAQLAGLGTAAMGLVGLGPATEPAPREEGREKMRHRLGEMAGDTATLVMFSLLCYLDIFMVKHHWFDPAQPGLVEEVALYSRAALVAKSFLFLASALNMVLLPAAAAARVAGSDARGLLLKFVGLASVAEFGGLALMWFFTPWMLTLLVGPGFDSIAPLTRWFCVAVVPLALFQLVMFFLIAMRHRGVVWLVGLTVAVLAGLLEMNHGNGLADAMKVVASVGSVALAALAIGLVLALRPHGKTG